MEALVFGIIALRSVNGPQELALRSVNGSQEPVVPEPAEFEGFDLRTLEYVAQTVS